MSFSDEGNALSSHTSRGVWGATALLLLIGVYVRFDELGRRWGDIDSLVTIAGPYMINQGQPMTVSVPGTGGRWSTVVDAQSIKRNPFLYASYISRTQTYAPLQFFLHPLLLSGEYEYREFLWRGRFLSALFSSLSLLAFLYLYHSWRGRLDAAALLGLGVLSFSLINITYAQQAIPYAFGVLSCALLAGFTIRRAGQPTRFAVLARWSCFFALLCYTNYQILLMTPVAFLTLFLCEACATRPSPLRPLLTRYAFAAALMGLLVLPLVPFLFDKGRAGNVNAPGFQSFYLSGVERTPLSLLSFYPRSLWKIVETTFTVSSGTLALGTVAVLFCLLLWGGLFLLRNRNPQDRGLKVFFLVLTGFWILLNLARKAPFSPTRHVLALSPVLALLLSVGATRLRMLPAAAGRIGALLPTLLLILVGTQFALHYETFRREHRDPFDVAEFRTLLQENHVDTIVGYGATWNPAIMFRTSEPTVRFVDLDAILRKGPKSLVSLPEPPFLLVSHCFPIEGYPEAAAYLEERKIRVRRLLERPSDVEMHPSREVRFGPNALYISIAER